jgi:hypothetical protein
MTICGLKLIGRVAGIEAASTVCFEDLPEGGEVRVDTALHHPRPERTERAGDPGQLDLGGEVDNRRGPVGVESVAVDEGSRA